MLESVLQKPEKENTTIHELAYEHKRAKAAESQEAMFLATGGQISTQ